MVANSWCLTGRAIEVKPVRNRKPPAEKPENEGRGLLCVAHNCPLVGTISDSTAGGNWKCWAHDRLDDPKQTPFLTQGINDNIWIFNFQNRVITMPQYDLSKKRGEIENFLRAKGKEFLIQKPNTGEWPANLKYEPWPFWICRIRAEAYKMAFDYVVQHWMGRAA